MLLWEEHNSSIQFFSEPFLLFYTQPGSDCDVETATLYFRENAEINLSLSPGLENPSEGSLSNISDILDIVSRILQGQQL